MVFIHSYSFSFCLIFYTLTCEAAQAEDEVCLQYACIYIYFVCTSAVYM